MPEMNHDIDIYVATHKEIDYILPDGYKPMQVNCKVSGTHWDGYLHDDDGDNISQKNSSYCELTVLYSLWKNSQADIKGLCHYRRYLTGDPNLGIGIWKGKSELKRAMPSIAIQKDEIVSALKDSDIILPIPNGPFPGQVSEERLQYCYKKDLDALRQVIQDSFCDYLDSFDWVMNQRVLPSCNLLIAKREVFDNYCEWLFSVLSKTEEKCDISSYDTQHKRLYGFLAEILINVYTKQNGLRCKYYNKVLLSDYWEQSSNLLKRTIKRSYPFQLILKAGPSAFAIWCYKHFKKKQYEDYLLLKQYLADREAEAANSGK